MRIHMIFQSSYVKAPFQPGSPVWHQLARIQDIVRIDKKDIVKVPVAGMAKEK